MFLREERGLEGLVFPEKVKIGVMGIAPGAGTTFIATSLAAALTQADRKNKDSVDYGKKECPLVGFLEIAKAGGTYIFDSLGMDKRFAGREFFDFYSAVKNGDKIRGWRNLDEGINWVLRVPSVEIEELSLLCKMRILHNLDCDILICDIKGAGREDEDLLEIAKEMDLIIFVIDPKPSSLIWGSRYFKWIKGMENKGARVAWIVNRYNEGIHKRELNSFLKLRDYIRIPVFRQELFYMAEYGCKVPYAAIEIGKEMRGKLEEIMKLHKIYI